MESLMPPILPVIDRTVPGNFVVDDDRARGNFSTLLTRNSIGPAP